MIGDLDKACKLADSANPREEPVPRFDLHSVAGGTKALMQPVERREVIARPDYRPVAPVTTEPTAQNHWRET